MGAKPPKKLGSRYGPEKTLHLFELTFLLLIFFSTKAEEPLDDCARANIDAAQKTSPWKSIIGKLLESENCSSNQKLLIMRHAERVDYVFPKWTEQCFGEEFGYERLDLNLPLAIPNRRNGVYRYPWKLDAPITNVGMSTRH